MDSTGAARATSASSFAQNADLRSSKTAASMRRAMSASSAAEDSAMPSAAAGARPAALPSSGFARARRLLPRETGVKPPSSIFRQRVGVPRKDALRVRRLSDPTFIEN